MSIALAPPVVVRQLKAERLTRAAPAATALGFLLPAISSSLTPCNPGKIHHTSIIITIIKGNETGKIMKSKKLETLPFQHQQEMAKKSSHSSTNKYAKP
jgi:hypothetical protein